MFRKIKMFMQNNKIWVIIGFVVLVLLGLSVYGMSKLESFYRTMTLAQMPVQLILALASAAAFVFMYVTFFSRGGFGNVKKNKIKSDRIKVTFKEVIGLEGAKKEALEVVQLIKDRTQLQKMGGKIIKGLLLMGPPGTGKTLLAKAIATECGIPFISMAGSEFVEVFVGVGAGRVRNLFKKAREYAYTDGACIIFIDEIEVIGRGRTFSYMGGGEETNSTQNQLLVEMDGLESKGSNVIVIAATNADEGVLDKALLRPGRFDRKITITLPNLKEREQLFDFYLKKVNISPDVNISRLAKKSVRKSPADIENIAKEAALIATRKGKENIDMQDISEAMDRIDLGLETHLEMTPKELEMVAYHEAGHAIALYMLHPTDDVFKITVKSHGSALGLVSHYPKEELHTSNKEKYIADIIVSLASHVAEKIKYGTTSNGVSADFRNAMQIANLMVWCVGMGNSGYVGDFSAIPKELMSESLKEKLNNETIEVLNSCYAKAEELLKANWDAVDAVAKRLLTDKEMDFDDLEETLDKLGKKKPQVIPESEMQKTLEGQAQN
ncbi:MAG: AAA family ATPase [Endomicrobium sp.]|jgi:cell division protease FtsH|nr:AAA family ATPase [Endomicrobium sp.]